jgi:hypothetical protein
MRFSRVATIVVSMTVHVPSSSCRIRYRSIVSVSIVPPVEIFGGLPQFVGAGAFGANPG